MRIEIDVPDGKSGDWEVASFEITEQAARMFNLRQMLNGHRRVVEVGHYKKLTRCGHIIMSNTIAEINDHMVFISAAEYYGGDILINGLGLGVALKEILTSDKVTSVTIIEKEQDVINLVADTYLKDARVLVIKADALEYKASVGRRFSVVWHDIWDDITSDNLETMGTLHRKYGRRCDWQGSWLKETCRQLHKEEKKMIGGVQIGEGFGNENIINR